MIGQLFEINLAPSGYLAKWYVPGVDRIVQPGFLLAVVVLGVATGQGNMPMRAVPSAATAARTTAPRATPTPPATKPIVVIDPGHGGAYTGGVYVKGGKVVLMEKTVTLEIAKRAASLLRRAGYTVFLTRTGDTAVNNPPKDINGDGAIDGVDDLEARIVSTRRHKGAIFVCMHINATSDSTTGGLTVYYNKVHPFWRKNLLLANSIDHAVQGRLTHAGYTPLNRGVHTDTSLTGVYQRYPDYPYFLQIGPADKKHGLISQNAVSALGETLFITDTKEEKLLTQSKYLEAIATGYSYGVERYVAHTK